MTPPEIETTPPRDAVGAATLDLLRTHDSYSRLIWKRLNSLGSLAGKVLEVGSGIGTFSRMILGQEAVTLLHSVDIDARYVERLKDEVGDPRLEVYCSPAEDFTPPDVYDHAVSINVFEHIENDVAAMKMVHRALRPGGEFWILVPAHPFLYSALDAGLSHHRRYTRRGLEALARKGGLVPERVFHFNPVGALGWWFTGKVLRRRELAAGQISAYDRYGIVVSRLFDVLNPLPFGISLLARLRKPLRA